MDADGGVAVSRFLIGVGLFVAIGLASITGQQTVRWESDQALWCHAVTLAPEKPRPLINCAAALMKAGASDRALPLLERAAVALENPQRPDNRRGHQRDLVAMNRALALVALQRSAEAKQAFAHVTDPLFRDSPRFQWLR